MCIQKYFVRFPIPFLHNPIIYLQMFPPISLLFYKISMCSDYQNKYVFLLYLDRITKTIYLDYAYKALLKSMDLNDSFVWYK